MRKKRFCCGRDSNVFQAREWIPLVTAHVVHVQKCFTSAAFLFISSSVSCEESPLGVEDRDRLPDSSFEASSFFQQTFAPSMARLNGKYAWCANTTNVPAEYLEIHIPYADRICAIATQGTGFKYNDSSLSNKGESVTDYSVEYSDDGSHWNKIEKVKSMTGVVSFPAEKKLIIIIILPFSLLGPSCLCYSFWSIAAGCVFT